MQMILFLINFVSTRGFLSEFPNLTVENVFPYYYQEDVPVKSDTPYGFMTSFSVDDEYEHEMLKVLVLGYNLMTVAPDVDRILVIPTNLDVNYINEDRLSKVWTHIYRMNHLEFPCNKTLVRPEDRHIWLKLTAWLFDTYKKILWIGHDTFFVKSPSHIFDIPGPAAPPDYQIWGYSEFGVVHNNDFLLFEPNVRHFLDIRQISCDWIDSPNVSNARIRHKDYQYTGAYDNGLIEEFYRGNITTLPFWWNFEIPGNRITRADKSHQLDPRIISYRFSHGNMPWDEFPTIVHQAWANLAIDSFNFFETSLDLAKYGIEKPYDRSALNMLMKDNKNINKNNIGDNDNNEEKDNNDNNIRNGGERGLDRKNYLATFKEFAKIENWQIAIRVGVIIALSFAVVKMEINNANMKIGQV